ncbi:MAG: hypothetical protein AAB019_03445 [Planctomycetota bacterium]
MMKQSKLNDRFSQSGLTMVEVIVAMTLLTVGVVFILSVMVSALQQREVSRERDIAKNAAVAKLEEIKAYTFSSIYTTYNQTYFNVSGLVKRTDKSDEGYSQVNNSNVNLLDVTVTIYWKSTTGKDEDMAMWTMVAPSSP